MRALLLIFTLLAPLPAASGGLAAARTLPAGTIIGAADLRAVDGDGRALTDPSQVIGKQTRITIYEGRPIQATLLQAPKLVGRNQIVRLSFRRGALRIDMQARTLSEGAAGDVIRVMNLDSRNIVAALVEDDGTLTALN